MMSAISLFPNFGQPKLSLSIKYFIFCAWFHIICTQRIGLVNSFHTARSGPILPLLSPMLWHSVHLLVFNTFLPLTALPGSSRERMKYKKANISAISVSLILLNFTHFADIFFHIS